MNNIANNIINNNQNENNIFYQNVRFLSDFMPRLNNNLEVNVYCNNCNTYICECKSCGENICECENPNYINSLNPFYNENIENMLKTCKDCFNNRENILVTFLVDNQNINVKENNFIRIHYLNYYINYNNINLNNMNNNKRSFNNFDDFIDYVFDLQNMVNSWNVDDNGIINNDINNNNNNNNNINNNNNNNRNLDIMNYLFENQLNFDDNLNDIIFDNILSNIHDNIIS